MKRPEIRMYALFETDGYGGNSLKAVTSNPVLYQRASSALLRRPY